MEPDEDKKKAEEKAEEEQHAEVDPMTRCTLGSGSGWQCKNAAATGFTYCTYHRQKFESYRSQRRTRHCPVTASMSRTRRPSKTKVKDVPKPEPITEVMEVEERQVMEVEERQVYMNPTARCRVKSGRGWQCKNSVAPGHTLCSHHINMMKIWRGGCRQPKETASKSRARREFFNKAMVEFQGYSDKDGFQYYDGFVPGRWKTARRGGGGELRIGGADAKVHSKEDGMGGDSEGGGGSGVA